MEKPSSYELIIKVDKQEWQRCVLEGVPLCLGGGLLSVFVVQRSGLILALLCGICLCGFGLFRVFYGVWLLWRDPPAFEGSRAGFRIRGGPLRSWSQYHSVRVKEIRGGKPSRKVGEAVQIRVKQRGLFQYRTVANLLGVERGRMMVYEIDTLHEKLRGLWASEEHRLNPTAAPGVAARNKKFREGK